MKKKNRIVLWSLAGLLFLLGSCDLFVPEVPPGQIYFEEFTEASRVFGGQSGAFDFGENLAKLGDLVDASDPAVQSLKMGNSGEGPLTIDNIELVGVGFIFPEGQYPDLPLTIPAGDSRRIYIQFDPEVAGDFTGQLLIDTGGTTWYFDLTGTGLWQLTLSVAASGDSSMGTITSPATVNEGGTVEITSSTGVFNLVCQPDFLYEFVQWTVVGTPIIAPVFANYKARQTQVTLNSHTSITVEIRDPFVRVPDDTGSIQTAINDCRTSQSDPDPVNRKIAVIVSQGTYTEANISLSPDVPVYGGYNTAWTSRDYQNRTSSQAIINLSGSLSAGSSVGSNVLVEGFLINRTGTGESPLVSFSGGTQAILQYCTLTSRGYNTLPSDEDPDAGSPAIRFDGASNVVQNSIINGGSGELYSTAVDCVNDGSPILRSNTITAGTANPTSDFYAKSFGVSIRESSTPILYKNTISGGTATGTGGETYAVFQDFSDLGKDYQPILWGNTLSGGTASGTEGLSHGICSINNTYLEARYNTIDGGSGKTAYGAYGGYGANLYLYDNNIFTSGGTNRYGVYLWLHGRVRKLLGNGIYQAPTGLFHTSIPSTDYTDIDDVNDEFNASNNLNQGSALTITVPTNSDYE